jgi:hypothetical protein
MMPLQLFSGGPPSPRSWGALYLLVVLLLFAPCGETSCFTNAFIKRI